MSVRDYTVEQAAALMPGDAHYRAFVGPTYRYDLIGAALCLIIAAAPLIIGRCVGHVIRRICGR